MLQFQIKSFDQASLGKRESVYYNQKNLTINKDGDHFFGDRSSNKIFLALIKRQRDIITREQNINILSDKFRILTDSEKEVIMDQKKAIICCLKYFLSLIIKTNPKSNLSKNIKTNPKSNLSKNIETDAKRLQYKLENVSVSFYEIFGFLNKLKEEYVSYVFLNQYRREVENKGEKSLNKGEKSLNKWEKSLNKCMSSLSRIHKRHTTLRDEMINLYDEMLFNTTKEDMKIGMKEEINEKINFFFSKRTKNIYFIFSLLKDNHKISNTSEVLQSEAKIKDLLKEYQEILLQEAKFLAEKKEDKVKETRSERARLFKVFKKHFQEIDRLYSHFYA